MKKNATNQKLLTKVTAFILCLLILFLSTPSVIFAEIADGIDYLANTDSSSENEIDIYSYAGEVYEVVALREEGTKYFHLEDGTYVAAQYDYPVHYTDENGVLQDIDNSLSEASGGVFATPTARIKFVKKITGNDSLFTLHDGNTKLTLSLNNAIKGVKGSVVNYDDSEETTKLQKMMNLEKLSSSIIYKEILSGVDLEYIVQSNNIKENIIVKKKSDSYSYSFELKLNGMTATLSDSGDVLIFNEETDEIKYSEPVPE